MALYASLSRTPLVGMLTLPLGRFVLDFRSLFVLPWGLYRLRDAGRTPEPALQAMIWCQ